VDESEVWMEKLNSRPWSPQPHYISAKSVLSAILICPCSKLLQNTKQHTKESYRGTTLTASVTGVKCLSKSGKK